MKNLLNRLVIGIAVMVCCSMVWLLSAKQVQAADSIQVFHEDFADISDWRKFGANSWMLGYDDLGQTVVSAPDLYLGTNILNNNTIGFSSNYSNELTITLVLRFLQTGHGEMAGLLLGSFGQPTIPGNLQLVLAWIRTNGTFQFRVDESIDTVGNSVTVLDTGVHQSFPVDGNMHALQFNRSAEGIWTVTLDDTIILSGVESTVASGSAFNYVEIRDMQDYIGAAERRRYDDLSISVGVPDCADTEAELAAALADLAAAEAELATCEGALATAENCIADTNLALDTTGCPADSIGTWYLPPGIDKNQPTLSRNPNAVVIKGVKQ